MNPAPSEALATALSARAIRTEVLPGGIRLVSDPMADVHSVAVGFWVGIGSRDEAEELAGASHFLEHLLFKGTARRSAAAIAEELDAVGGDCNAFTTKEFTAFYVRLLAEHLSLGLEILTDIMKEPALRPSDVDAERKVILDEILMHADEPSDLVWERWQSALFPSHPLGRDTLGTAQSVEAITAEDIAEFFASHYRPANLVVSIAGDCDHEDLAGSIAARFAGVSGGEVPTRRRPEGDVVPLVVERRATEQAHLVFGCRAFSRFDDDRWALSVFNQVLGGGLSSRLFQKIREERGLAYSVWSDRSAYHDTGSIAVGAGTAPANVDEVLRIVGSELEAMAESGITDKELAIAKGNLRADALLSCEDSGARMSRAGSALLLQGEATTVEEQLAHIDDVDPDDVLRVARRLAEEPKVLAVVGPFDADDFHSDLLDHLGLPNPEGRPRV